MSFSKTDWLAVIFVLSGLAIASITGSNIASAEPYEHAVTGKTSQTAVVNADVMNHSELSKRTRGVFRRALDRRAEIETATELPEFTYPGDAPRLYYVRYRGTVYEFSTYYDSPATLGVAGRLITGLVLALSGAVVLLFRGELFD